MADANRYSIHLEPKFGFLELVDVPGLAREVEAGWFNQTLCAVNDCVVRLGVMTGEFHWHKHDDEDEFFFVLEGCFLIDLQDRTVRLEAHQGFTVPKGVLHRTRAPERAVILMVEGRSIRPTGDPEPLPARDEP
jgi:mannose-6-phosphate isomerase-like protein (cupin superfamily)